MDFSLVVASRCCILAAMPEPLIVVASLDGECRVSGTQASGVAARSLSSYGSPALEDGLSSCVPWASWLHGMWNLPKSGMELVSPALASRFLTTESAGKPSRSFLVYISNWMLY